MSKAAKIYTINVQVDSKDKRLLDLLVQKEKLPRTEVIRRLIRSAGEQITELRMAANG